MSSEKKVFIHLYFFKHATEHQSSCYHHNFLHGEIVLYTVPFVLYFMYPSLIVITYTSVTISNYENHSSTDH
jgi:hypothetical protein